MIKERYMFQIELNSLREVEKLVNLGQYKEGGKITPLDEKSKKAFESFLE